MTVPGTNCVRYKSTLTREQLDTITNGPGLEDFVTGSAPPSLEHLKRKKGERLQLPKWLRTDAPKGKNFTRLKQDLRRLKLTTVSIWLPWLPLIRRRVCLGMRRSQVSQYW